MATITGQIRLAGLRVAGAMVYDNRVVRYREGRASGSFQSATAAARPLQARWDVPLALSPMQDLRWEQGEPAGNAHAFGYAKATSRNMRRAAVWERALLGREAQSSMGFQAAGRVRSERGSMYQVGMPAGTARRDGYERASWQVVMLLQTWQSGGPAGGAWAEGFQPATPANGPLLFVVPWQLGSRTQYGRVAEPPDPVDPGEPTDPVAQIIVPIRRIYMQVNSIVLRRASDDAELPASAFNLSIDADSWTWSFSASLYKSTLPLVLSATSEPVQLKVTINGVEYRLLVSSVNRSRRFPETRITIAGRGLSAQLAEPQAAVQTFSNSAARTAQQLMSDVLTVNGVSLGWTLDWGITDWLVPAGAWSFRGTYMQAVADIAAAVGAYVQPHRTDPVLRVLPRYPTAPWNWGSVAPDIELPAAAVALEGIAWEDKPAYNRVYVGGLSAGVFGPVTRLGTGGDVIAPQITHALITDADAQRQRGLAELSDTGRQAQVQLKLQLLPETGLILPGKFVRYVAGPSESFVEIVRASSLEWSSPAMRQTITIETHA